MIARSLENQEWLVVAERPEFGILSSETEFQRIWLLKRCCTKQSPRNRKKENVVIRNNLFLGIGIILRIAPAIVVTGTLILAAGCSSEPDYTDVPVQYSEDPMAAAKDTEAAKEASDKAAGSGGGK
jgi:hypothetical protein